MKRITLVLFLLHGCYSSAGTGYRDDAAEDGGPDAAHDADTVTDEPAGEFCSGAAKVELNGRTVQPVAVTTTELIMNCCWGTLLKFHTQDTLGLSIVVSIIEFVGTTDDWPAATADLEDLPEGLEVAISLNEGGEDEESVAVEQVEGWLEIEGSAYDEPYFISLCAEGRYLKPDGSEGSLKLYAQDVILMPYTWYQRFGVYLLRDTGIPASEAADMPLDSLELQDAALIDLWKVHYYHAGEHALHMDTMWGPPIRELLPDVGFYGLPFVVTADDARIYLGAFVSWTTSASFDFPVIILEDMQDDRIVLEPYYPPASPPALDPREDERIIRVFEETGKLVR